MHAGLITADKPALLDAKTVGNWIARDGDEAIKKFNRWARREAKRIAKEGNGK